MSRTAEPADITGDMTVNEIIQQRPQTLAVFNSYRIDSCCGGGLPLAEVAKRHRLDFIALVSELESA
jgi:iron-sulfur cluster repair protein YtfE (RIC family)